MKYKRVYNFYKNNGLKCLLRTIKAKYIIEAFAYEKKLDDIPEMRFENLYFSILTYDLLEKMGNQHKEEIPPLRYDQLKSRISKSSTIKTFVMLYDEEIAGFCNIEFGEYNESCTNVILGKQQGVAYLIDAHVFKSHRKKGVHTFDIYSRLLTAKSYGCHTVKIVILKGNEGSEKAYDKFEFKKYLKISRYKIGIFDKTFVKVVK